MPRSNGTTGRAACAAGVAAAALASTLAGAALAADSKQDDLTLASPGNRGSGGPATTFDGRYVFFTSDATNLGRPKTGIYVTDLVRRKTRAVRVPTLKVTAPLHLSVDAQGRRLAFERGVEATTACTGGGGFVTEIFVTERDTFAYPAGYRIASRATKPFLDPPTEEGALANAACTRPALSADGTRVVFLSRATNLAGPGVHDDCSNQVYVRNLRDKVTTLVSHAPDGSVGDRNANDPVVSETGRYVAWWSNATNILPPAQEGVNHVYRRDVQTGVTTRVTNAADVARPIGGSVPAMSADGRFVAFVGSDGIVYRRDMDTDEWLVVSRADGPDGVEITAASPRISADGRYVAFSTTDARAVGIDFNGLYNIVVRDVVAGATVLASRASGPDGRPNDAAINPDYVISGNGRRLAFSCESNTISKLDRNDTFDVYVRDLLGPPPDTVPPKLRNVRLSAKQIAVAADCAGTPPAQSVLSLATTEGGALEVQFQRKLRIGVAVVATLTGEIAAGESQTDVTGCDGDAALAKGAYTLQVTVTDAAGNVSKPKKLRLNIR